MKKITVMMTPVINKVLVKKGMISCRWKFSIAIASHLRKGTSSNVISGIETDVLCKICSILTSVGMGYNLMSLIILLSDNCSAILIVGLLSFEPFGT